MPGVRACVRAGPGGWAEGRGGLGALPPRASPGPAALGEPGLPGSRSLLRAVRPRGVWLSDPPPPAPPRPAGL